MESSPGLGVALAFYNDEFLLRVVSLFCAPNEGRTTDAQTESETGNAQFWSPLVLFGGEPTFLILEGRITFPIQVFLA